MANSVEDLQITLMQTSLFWEDIDANLAMFEEKIWQIDSQSDIIVLPEMFSTGFTTNAKLWAEPMNGKTFKWMRQQSAQTNAAIVGSYMVRVENHYFNRLIWMQPDGKYFAYDKRHTFKLTGENEVFQSGTEKLIVQWRGWKICPLICDDLRFPVWSRNKVIDGVFDYDLLIYVANWPSSRNGAWETLLKARAVENSCYCAGLNIIGKDGRGFYYIGNSAIFNPLVENIIEPFKEDGSKSASLSKENLNEYRIKYPFLEDGDGFDLKI